MKEIWNVMIRAWRNRYNKKRKENAGGKTHIIDTFMWKQFVKKPIFDNLFAYLCKTKKFTREDIVLEFGIGKCGFGTFYKKYFNRVYGADIFDYSSFHKGVEFLVLENNRIPLPDNSIDLLASHSVLEHVDDINKVLLEFNRVVKVGGTFFLTVSPLYYSGFGSHVYVNGERLDNWQHLDPDSPFYLIVDPRGDKPGTHLNMLTSSKFVFAVEKLPWRIDKYETFPEKKEPPSYVDLDRFPLADLLAKEFRFIGTKMSMNSY